MQQDAHEFFNYLLNAISEKLSEAEQLRKEANNETVKLKKSAIGVLNAMPNGTDASRYIF